MTALCNILWFVSCLPGAVVHLVAACFPRGVQTRTLRRILRCNASSEFGRRYGFSEIAGPGDYAARVPVSEYRDYAGVIEELRVTGGQGRLVSEPVRVLEPTSGTGSRAKLIPYTRSLRHEFLAAVHPWLANLYMTTPSLFLGRQYWSLSPNTQAGGRETESGIRVGFADDTEYLGTIGRRVARRVLSVPSELAQVDDPAAFAYLTLLFLVRDANLRLVSVWHPSFFTILLNALPSHWPQLLEDIRSGRIRLDLGLSSSLRATLEDSTHPLPRRADELAALDPGQEDAPGRIWPRLKVISCWTREGGPWLSQLRTAFPNAWIQEKGLVATEGIVTIPLGRTGARKAAAVSSHFLEFLDGTTGDVKRLWELSPGTTYAVLLTTGGGLYRYALHDRVEVDGRFLRAPCLRFLGREGCVSDMVGEKLDLSLAEEAFTETESRLGVSLTFGMLAPEWDIANASKPPASAHGDGGPPPLSAGVGRHDETKEALGRSCPRSGSTLARNGGGPPSPGAKMRCHRVCPAERDAPAACGYVCYVAVADGDSEVLPELRDCLEGMLQKAYHYRHARRLGQLRAVRVFELTGSPDAEFLAHRQRQGVKRGDVKFLRLSCESGWHAVFEGQFVEP